MRNYFYFLGMKSDLTIHWYALLLLALPTILRLTFDWYTISRKKVEVNHKQHTIFTALGMIIVSWIVWRIEPVQYLIQPVFLSIGIFVLFFDYMLNLLRGKNFFYIDRGTDGKQSLSDKAYSVMGTFGTAFFKLWVVGVCMGVYFYMSYIHSYNGL